MILLQIEEFRLHPHYHSLKTTRTYATFLSLGEAIDKFDVVIAAFNGNVKNAAKARKKEGDPRPTMGPVGWRLISFHQFAEGTLGIEMRHLAKAGIKVIEELKPRTEQVE